MSRNVGKQRMLFVEVSRCLACRSCEMACAVEHSASRSLVEAVAEDPRPVSRVKVEAAGEWSVPLQCRHCEDAPCVAICPTKALEKADVNSPVLIDEDRCIGCKFCIMVCPFGVIALRSDGKVALKCDLCAQRLESDEEPACVSACPTGALRFVSPAEAAAGKRRATARAMEQAEKKARSAAKDVAS